jgi:hypothetical protein
MRPEGHYWVWIDGRWTTAYWDGEDWLLPGTEEYFTDDSFERITAPITPPWTGFEPVETSKE